MERDKLNAEDVVSMTTEYGSRPRRPTGRGDPWNAQIVLEPLLTALGQATLT